MQYQLVRVFNKSPEASGNLAAVITDENNRTISELTKISADLYKTENITTTCFIGNIEKNHYKVSCFNSDNPIQCCGHGMIAAAKTVFQQTDSQHITINKNIYASSIKNSKFNNHTVELKLPRVAADHCAVPIWAENVMTCFGEKLLPTRAAKSPSGDGYILLEFEPELQYEKFKNMILNHKQICDNTQRAVAVIQFNKKIKKLHMRYFAPQYGVLEDSATGSVMRFIADYIDKQYQTKQFDVYQSSSQGGYMNIVNNENDVSIFAHANVEALS